MNAIYPYPSPKNHRAIVHFQVVRGNAGAIQKGNEQIETTIDGQRWMQPAFPYQAICLQWINTEGQELDDAAQAQIDDVLSETGCDTLIINP